jgi:transposase
LPSVEGWTVVWVWSTLLTLRQEARRQRNMAAAGEELTDLRERLAGPRARLRRAADIDFQIKTILEKHHVARYLKVERTVREDHIYKQARPGRPGLKTAYRKVIKRRFDIEWTIDQEAIAYDHKSDGMYPLITNDRAMSPAQVLEAHKGQPMIEKRFEQLKTVHEIAPVFLKNEGRIEALFTLYFLELLVQAIIERELRLARETMARRYRRANLHASHARLPHVRHRVGCPVAIRHWQRHDRVCAERVSGTSALSRT